MRHMKNSHWCLVIILTALLPLYTQRASKQSLCKTPAAQKQSPGAPEACKSPCQFRFVVYGDTRNSGPTAKDGDSTHQNILEFVKGYNPLLILQTGDLVFDGGDEKQWETFNRLTCFGKDAKITANRISYYPTPGNHDKCTRSNYEGYIPPGVRRNGKSFDYAFDVGTIRFIAIDTVIDQAKCNTQPTGDFNSQSWLEGELKTARKERKLVVPFFHHAIWSVGQHGGEQNITLRHKLHDEIFKRYQNVISLVFQGHDHIYYRAQRDGITYVTSGGGGVPLPNDDQLKLSECKAGDLFKKAFNFSVCDVYPDKIEVRTYISDDSGSKFDLLFDAFTIPRETPQ